MVPNNFQLIQFCLELLLTVLDWGCFPFLTIKKMLSHLACTFDKFKSKFTMEHFPYIVIIQNEKCFWWSFLKSRMGISEKGRIVVLFLLLNHLILIVLPLVVCNGISLSAHISIFLLIGFLFLMRALNRKNIWTKCYWTWF